MTMLDIYRLATSHLEPALQVVLNRRIKNGKEASERIGERKGFTTRERPDGTLIHLHAASVGEAQSAMIIIDRLLKDNPALNILVTTGTLTSAKMLLNNLPERALHQFAPLDHPDWVRRFLDHWKPDLVLWMESELWPNMLLEIKQKKIPAILINARLSDKSYRRWKFFKNAAREILSCFDTILAQTAQDAGRFETLGARNVSVTDNLKFSAKPLDCAEYDLQVLSGHIRSRPLWLFASTHKGEETMAARIHERLKSGIPDVLTIIVPRHPARRDEIKAELEKTRLNVTFRGENKTLPKSDTNIYVADTMGELGLFYRLAPVACIGRSFSFDGGGGHNPIEAAQLNCAVLYGPRVQFQQAIYDEMTEAKAAERAENETALTHRLHELLGDPAHLAASRKAAADFLRRKETIVDRVMAAIAPHLEQITRQRQAR